MIVWRFRPSDAPKRESLPVTLARHDSSQRTTLLEHDDHHLRDGDSRIPSSQGENVSPRIPVTVTAGTRCYGRCRRGSALRALHKAEQDRDRRTLLDEVISSVEKGEPPGPVRRPR